MEDFLVAGFVTTFLHPQIPISCVSFNSLFMRSLDHLSKLQFASPAPHSSVSGHLRLPVTGDATLEQKRGSSYKFVVLAFSREFLPQKGIVRGTSFHKADFGDTSFLPVDISVHRESLGMAD